MKPWPKQPQACAAWAANHLATNLLRGRDESAKSLAGLTLRPTQGHLAWPHQVVTVERSSPLWRQPRAAAYTGSATQQLAVGGPVGSLVRSTYYSDHSWTVAQAFELHALKQQTKAYLSAQLTGARIRCPGQGLLQAQHTAWPRAS
jgi:hypothetical protein